MPIMGKNRPSSGLALFATIIAAALVWLAPQLSVRAQQQSLLPGADDQGAQPWRPAAYSKVVPLTGVSGAAIRLAVASGTTVPMWNFSLISPVDGNPYSGVIVGRSPFFHGARTTNVAVVIIPLIVNMPDGGVFDPTAADPCAQSKSALALVQESPILQTSSFSINGTGVGTTQYIDAFQRANFWGANVSITEAATTRCSVQ